MLLVQTCFIPAMADKKLALVCEKWLKRLKGRLDERQFGYLENLRLAKFGHTVFAGRLLARLMLLSALSPGQKLFSKNTGFPLLENPGYAVCFSYCSTLAASALFTPPCARENLRFALDVEEAKNIDKANGPFYSLRHLKNWLKYEIAIKAAPARPLLAKMNKISPIKREEYAGGGFWHKFVAMPGHIIGIGANFPLPKKITLEVMDIRQFL